MNYKVLITTSGVGSRLGELTKFTNKCLISVGDKPAISHIIEKYPPEITIVVTLGYFGDQVKDFLTLAYPGRVFEFIKVENYDGIGSSLGNSLMSAKEYLNIPFIFHASDTLLLSEEVIPEPNRNWVGGSIGNNGSEYCTFEISGGSVEKFHSKGMLDFDLIHIGIVGIQEHRLFWETLADLLGKNFSDKSLSDVDVLKVMKSSGSKFDFQEFDGWFDSGNVSGLNLARDVFRKNYEILEKAEENVFFLEGGDVIKFFYDEETVYKRVERARILGDLVPEVIASSKNFYQYKFQAGTELSQLVSTTEMKKFLGWAKERLWIKKDLISNQKFSQICMEFYKNKTLTRIKEFKITNENIDGDYHINNFHTPCVEVIMKNIDFRELSLGKQSQYHGDLVLDNILKTNAGYKLLDWRQDFGGSLTSGDIYYDLAKLNHSMVVNHKIVNNNLFSITSSRGHIECDIYRPHSLVEGQEVLRDFIVNEGYSWKKVEILTAIIWINMSPLHHYPFNQFLFQFGKYNLWKLISSNV